MKFKEYGQNVRWGRDSSKLCIPSSIRISERHKISIGNNCRIDDGVYLQCHTNGDGITLEEGVSINANTHIQAYSKILIKSNSLIAPFCLISSGNHGYSLNKAISNQEYIPSGEIILDEGCWLGHGVKILGGCKIPKNSVVAAGAVCKGEFLQRSIIAGIPAKVQKKI